MTRILLIEDEEMISDIVTEFLKNANYEVTACLDGQQGLDTFYNASFDLVLLDIMLPTISGLDILKEIRETSNIPIIMITALNDEYTQLTSFNYEVDDFIPKPFSPSILVKRVESVLRRYQVTPDVHYQKIGKLKISYDQRSVYYDNQLIDLTKKEFDILYCLAKRPNHLIPRGQIIYQVWGYQDDLDTRLLDNHFKNIRKKIPDITIQTVTGIGYKLGVS